MPNGQRFLVQSRQDSANRAGEGEEAALDPHLINSDEVHMGEDFKPPSSPNGTVIAPGGYWGLYVRNCVGVSLGCSGKLWQDHHGDLIKGPLCNIYSDPLVEN